METQSTEIVMKSTLIDKVSFLIRGCPNSFMISNKNKKKSINTFTTNIFPRKQPKKQYFFIDLGWSPLTSYLTKTSPSIVEIISRINSLESSSIKNWSNLWTWVESWNSHKLRCIQHKLTRSSLKGQPKQLLNEVRRRIASKCVRIRLFITFRPVNPF